jgi:hypothetical protein
MSEKEKSALENFLPGFDESCQKMGKEVLDITLCG